MARYFSVFILFLVAVNLSSAQTQPEYSSAEIYKKIEKLNFLGNVLYVAAHPDDENTDMISYLSNKTNANVAYLSLNRGDGGQNLIGTEINELLGVIRTEELLAARDIDGGKQFFTRAIDFGYSKNPNETFNIWDKETVLGDVVWIFRKFRPDVVINRFNHRTEGDTHGHHTASAILSVEAYDLAGDKNAFANQLKDYQPWQPDRMYFNDSWFFYGSKEKYLAANHDGFLEINVGEFLPLLGKSNTEVSALSRSEHKSQGFGRAMKRGEDLHFFEPIKGNLSEAEKGIFEGIDTSWNRIEGGKAIGEILYKVQENYDFTEPGKSVSQLLKAYEKIQNLKDPYWRALKSEQIKEIIAASAGLYLEVSTAEDYATPGQDLKVEIEAINRSNVEVNLKDVKFSSTDGKAFLYNKELKKEQNFIEESFLSISKNAEYSNPYWLNEPHELGMYTIDNHDLLGLPNTPAPIIAEFQLKINGVDLTFQRALIHKSVDQIKGEVKEPFVVVPEVSVKMEDKNLVFPNDSSREITVEVKAFEDDVKGVLSLSHIKEWKISPKEIPVEIKNRGQVKTYTFEITPPKFQNEAVITPNLKIGEKSYTKELYAIDYPHIPLKNILLSAQTKVNRLNIQIAGNKIAYIKGSGDKIPLGLREIGYQVDELSGEGLTLQQLQNYDAVITGIRAYNVNDDLILKQDVLFEYAKKGGTVVTQYSQLWGMKTEDISPYPMTLSRERVTDENSPVKFLAPKHSVLNHPNKITQSDFEDWVQERGLYFPSEWSAAFTPILGMNDPGEKELQGSLLVADYGKGHYVYTGLSFFRELPAGVPGAYRLFANILAL